jgi:putative Mn2+ efflux pump MntP
MTFTDLVPSFLVLFLDRYENITNFFRRNVLKNKNVYKHDERESYWRSPAFWSRVLSKNLLALADTQLLTGLAVQFAAMLRHCEMSIYHFQIVTELAFLTTITHLLTVVTLRNYFVKYRWINLPRIFFMLGNLGLLGYTSFVSYSYDLAGLDLSSPLACFYLGARPPVHAAFGGKWAGLLIGAIGGHVTVILAMYVLEDDNNSDDGHNTKKNTSRWSWLKWFGAIFRTWIVAPIYAIYGVYMAGSGLKNSQALGTPNVTIDESKESEGEWGFGQFLPVLLLALPVFAGWESFWGTYIHPPHLP